MPGKLQSYMGRLGISKPPLLRRAGESEDRLDRMRREQFEDTEKEATDAAKGARSVAIESNVGPAVAFIAASRAAGAATRAAMPEVKEPMRKGAFETGASSAAHVNAELQKRKAAMYASYARRNRR